MTHLLWKMELHIKYAPVKLRPHIQYMYLKNLVDSMPRRLQDVIRKKGNPTTKYWAGELHTPRAHFLAKIIEIKN